MIITEKLRAKILLSLPKRYAKTLATQCQVSEQTIYNVLHYKSDNDVVRNAIMKLARTNKARIKREQKRVQRLAKQL